MICMGQESYQLGDVWRRGWMAYEMDESGGGRLTRWVNYEIDELGDG